MAYKIQSFQDQQSMVQFLPATPRKSEGRSLVCRPVNMNVLNTSMCLEDTTEPDVLSAVEFHYA